MEQLETLLQLAQIITVVSVVLGVWQIRSSMQMTQRQWNVDAFLMYTQRYEEITNAFPNDAFYCRFDRDRLPPSSAELTRCIRRYLNLVAEIRYLSQAKYVDNQVWLVWQEDIKATLKSELLMREWPIVEADYRHIPGFREFVKELQAKEAIEPAKTESSA